MYIPYIYIYNIYIYNINIIYIYTYVCTSTNECFNPFDVVSRYTGAAHFKRWRMLNEFDVQGLTFVK